MRVYIHIYIMSYIYINVNYVYKVKKIAKRKLRFSNIDSSLNLNYAL